MFGWKVLRQDLAFPAGVYGEFIGSDAADIPLPDESIDLMALHCSFEHFEGESDVGFIDEAQRLLTKGGRLVILPLYLSDRDRILTDPIVSVPQNVGFPAGIEVVCVPRWWNRHGRHYSIPTLVKRVLSRWKVGKPTIVRFGIDEAGADGFLFRFGLLLDKRA